MTRARWLVFVACMRCDECAAQIAFSHFTGFVVHWYCRCRLALSSINECATRVSM